MQNLKEMFLLLIVFVFVHIIMSVIAPSFITSSVFPYLDDLQKSGLPPSLYSFGNFDGAIYLKIAREGYLPLTQAFFPLYPILIFLIGTITPGHLFTSGLLVSVVSTIFAFIFFNKITQVFLGKHIQQYALITLLVFPTSFYLLAIYTESLFFALLCATIWFMHQKQYPIAVMTGILLGLTRVSGIFTSVIVLGILCEQQKTNLHLNSVVQTLKKLFRSPLKVITIIAPLIGFAMYSMYLHITTGDFLAFFHLQPLSNAGRSTELVLFPQVMYRYLKIFLTATPNFQYFVAVIEFIAFSGIGALLSYDLWKIMRGKTKYFWIRLGMNLFSFVNLILPTLTGTFTSLPRYALLSISIYFVLAEIEQRWLKIVIATIFLILHIILFMYFIQGYFVS